MLLEQVRTDPLTGLGNRGGMQVDLGGRCRARPPSNRLTLLLLDLNGFKRYNDTFGHPAGDEMLTRLGGQLRERGRRRRERLPDRRRRVLPCCSTGPERSRSTRSPSRGRER